MKCIGSLKSISLDWLTKKTEVTLEVDANAEDVERLKDKKLSVEMKQYRKKRSLDSNSYYWVLVQKIAEALNQSTSWTHNYMLRKYGQIEIIDGKAVYLVIPDTETAQSRADEAETYHIKPTSQVKEGKGGIMYRTYMMLRGSHEYNTEEMSHLIDGAVSDAKDLGIETLPPDEIKRMMNYDAKRNDTRSS